MTICIVCHNTAVRATVWTDEGPVCYACWEQEEARMRGETEPDVSGDVYQLVTNFDNSRNSRHDHSC